jgi:SAM-dependent methyltransferase
MLRIRPSIIGGPALRPDAPGADPGAGAAPRVSCAVPAGRDADDAAVSAPADEAVGPGAADGPIAPGDAGAPTGPTPAQPLPAAGREGGSGGDGPDPDAWHRWLGSPPGRYLLDWEQVQLDAAVGDVFGFHAVQCGAPQIDALRANRMPHRIAALLPQESLAKQPASQVRVEHFGELPFVTQSIDLVVLPHVLEFAHDPHQVLREVDRVLRPEGRLVVTGFNPVSLWGARQLAPGWLLEPFLPRKEHFIAAPRLRDWCKLLGFEAERARYGCYRLPCHTQLWLDRTRFMERAGDRWWPICGAVYIVSAIKRVHGMRLIGPAWKRAAAPRAIAVPSAQRSGLPPDQPAG